jgi:hypothetical protein
VLAGAAFGAVESATVDLAVAQPIKIAFGEQNGINATEILDSAGTGAAAGGLTGGFGAGAKALAGASDSLAPALGALNTLPGRMLVGGGMGAGQDALFNNGNVDPLDVLSGAIGGAASRGRGARSSGDAPDGYLPRTGGSTYIDGAQSDWAAQTYETIRNTPGDTKRIAANTGIDQNVLDRIKDHIFNNVHTDVPVPPNGTPMTGRFAPFDNIADLWTKADSGTLNSDEAVRFHRWAAHEGVESILMANGMPYRAGVWDDGVNFPTEDSFGAHDVAPHEYHADPFVAWPRRGLEKPDFPLSPDLSNLDQVAAIVLEKVKKQ